MAWNSFEDWCSGIHRAAMQAVIVTIVLAASVGLQHAFVLNNSNCPPEDLIRPCTCSNRELACTGILNGQELVTVFEKISGYDFDRISIESSTFQYIPHQIFTNVGVKTLFIRNTTLVQLFSSPPTTLSRLEQLFIFNCTILRRKWDHLASMTELKALNVRSTDVGVLDKTFGQSLPKKLEFLFITDVLIRGVLPGAFVGLENLSGISITKAGLTSLKRDMFPTPFNVELLLFSENMIESIPDDLFTQMPKVSIIDLSKNKLTALPERAFDGRASQLGFLMLDDNSLNCDCALEWMVKKKPEYVSGECQAPAKLKGKWLISLTEDDFNC